MCVAGLPGQRQAAASLITELRRVVADPTESPAMQRAATLHLAHLAGITGQQCRPAFREAHPENWQGAKQPSSPS